MATIIPPYADPGRASFVELDNYAQNNLLAGNHPELAPAFSYGLAINTSFAQFAVVGLDINGKIAMATWAAAAVAASLALTFSGVGTAADTITIAGRVYTLVAALTAADQVLIGASATATAANLTAAIMGAAAAGTTYGTGTLPNAAVTAVAAAAVVTVTAKEIGLVGNEIVVAESGTGTSWAGAATALAGGKSASGLRAIGVLAHAASLGASGTATGPVWYSGCFDQAALVWDASFDTDAKKQAAFLGARAPTEILIVKR